MELMTKQGFKQTEVGLVPDDWVINRIGDVAKTEGGYAFKSSKFLSAGTYQVVKMSNVYGSLLDLNRSVSFLNEIDDNEKKYLLKHGDILITLTGTVGKKDYGYTVLITKEINLLLNQRVARIVSRDTAFAPYVFFQLKMTGFSTQFFEAAKGGTGNQTNVGTKQVDDMLIPLPPTLTEQKAIATALSETDELITNLEQLIAKKKAIKQGVMQQLLTPPHKGGKRLDGFDGEWERIKVERVIDVLRGGSPRPIQDYITSSPEGVNWIKIGDTSPKSKYIVSSVEKITPEGQQYSRNVKVGDFLLSNSMSFGRPYILKIDGCVHDGWLVLQNYSEFFDREFLYYTLMSNDVFNQYLAKASGSGVLNLNKELVKVVELNRPKDLKEQVAIAQILSDMDAEIDVLEAKKAKYQDVKQCMMQELLTGKTRLV